MNKHWIRTANVLLFTSWLSLVSGCAEIVIPDPASSRTFDFKQDTFAYANELDWEYRIDPVTGQTTIQQNEPTPRFIHRCFAVSHMARQFFQYAQFDPERPKADEETYRQAIARVVSDSPGEVQRNGRVIIPGYANLRSFSRAEEALLKEASGSSLHSYFQLSNWRMIFPFSRDQQEATARQLLDEVRAGLLPIVHLIKFSPFPVTDINHVVLIFAAVETGQEIRFSVYDPNNFREPVVMNFDHNTRSFIFPTTNYFSDGPINAYEIYGDDIG